VSNLEKVNECWEIIIQDADDRSNDIEYVSICLEQAFANYNLRLDITEIPL
jgi:hypothetical protein